MRANIITESNQYKEISCAEIDSEMAEKMLALAAKLGVPADYVLSRIRHYDSILTGTRLNSLSAYQFLQQFSANGNLHIYHGPVFSVNGAFMQMFINHIYTTAQKCLGHNIYLLAEIQNPKMLMMLQGLFADFGYSFFSKNIPSDILNIVPVFKDRYRHIGSYDPINFTTHTISSVYKASSDCKKLTDWLLKHNISLQNGDNLLYAVKLPADTTAREEIFAQIHKGADEISHWSDFKHNFFRDVIKVQL